MIDESETGGTETGEGDDDPDTGDGDGDGDGSTTVALITRESLADGHDELVAFDISDPQDPGSPVTVLEAEYIWFGEPTLWGRLVRIGEGPSAHTVQEVRLDEMGNVELRSPLPDGVTGTLMEIHFATDGSWALAGINGAQGEDRMVRIDYDAEGVPVGATDVHDGSGDSVVLDGGRVGFVDDDDDDDVYQLHLVDLHPEVGPGVVVDDILIPPPFKFDLHLDETKLVYTKDLEQDGIAEQWSVDLDNLQAPPTLVTAQIDGPGPLVVRWSPSGERMLYSTGDGQAQRLFYVEFDGATPQAPVLVSGDDNVSPIDFEFASEDRFYYFATDENDYDQAIMLVDIDGTPTPAVQISEPLAPGFSIINSSFEPATATLAYAASSDEQSWLSLLDLSAAQPSALHVYDATGGGYIVPDIPELGGLMPFVAPVGDDERRVFTVDLDDPELPITLVDNSIPAADMPLSVTLTPDELQVWFRFWSDGDEDAWHMVAPTDGSGSFEALHEPGWSDGPLTILTTP